MTISFTVLFKTGDPFIYFLRVCEFILIINKKNLKKLEGRGGGGGGGRGFTFPILVTTHGACTD